MQKLVPLVFSLFNFYIASISCSICELIAELGNKTEEVTFIQQKICSKLLL